MGRRYKGFGWNIRTSLISKEHQISQKFGLIGGRTM